jgi:hypothetical protein
MVVILIPRACAMRPKPAHAERRQTSVNPVPAVRYFAKVAGTDIRLAVPASPSELIGIGLHQAENTRARPLEPIGRWVSKDSTTQAHAAVRRAHGRVVVFQMTSRGRGTSLRTAADCVVRPGTWICSPVSGEVTLIKHYWLYGRYRDMHVEIRPVGHPELRVACIHLRDLQVNEGDRVIAGETVIGHPRRFDFDSQVDRYVGGKWEHTHFQVNPYPPAKS